MMNINSVLQHEHRQRDERTLATVLICLNLMLLTLFFLVCLY